MGITAQVQQGCMLAARSVWRNTPLFTPKKSFWYFRPQTFRFDRRDYRLFVHNHNCGWPPGRMTERSVELALAHAWLDEADPARVIEVGAVTPYYWPRRVATVADPADDHPLVTERKSVSDIDLRGRHVLSLSTFEHIGSGEYGLPPAPEEGVRAFEKLFREAEAFLLTVPLGYNPHMDEYLTRPGLIPDDVSVKYLCRPPRGRNDWKEFDRPAPESLSYGFMGRKLGLGLAANTVVVMQRPAPRPAR